MAIKGIDAGRTDIPIVSQSEPTLVANVAPAMVEHGWAYQIAYRYSQNGSRSHRAQLWAANGNNPTNLIWSDQEFTFTENSPVQGSLRTRVIATPIPLTSGSRYAFGTAVAGGTWSIGQAASSSQTAQRLNIATTGPFDPFDTPPRVRSSIVYQIELDYEPNRSPSVPDQLAPAGITPNTITPTFTGRFADPDQVVNGNANAAEVMSQYQIQVRDAANPGGSLLADVLILASSNEQAADEFSWGYTGGTLTSGTTYEWRARVADHFAAWSDWSDTAGGWTAFTLGQVGTVTVAATRFPTLDAYGLPYTERSLSPTVIPATWHHPDGLAMKAVRVQFRQGASVARDKTFSGFNVASNGTFTILGDGTAWTGAPVMAPLARGQTYDLWTSGQDSNNAWAPLQKVATFQGNRQPLTPSQPSPTTGIFGSIPTLTVTATDADDIPASGLVTVIKLYRASDGANLVARAMTKRAAAADGTTNPYWDYTFPLADLEFVQGNSTGYGDFRWTCYAYDHIGSTPVSSESTFTYALLPNPVVTAPTSGQIVTDTTLPVSWTVDQQTQRQVTVRNAGSGTVVLQSSLDTTGTTNLTLDVGGLSNRRDYTVEVTVVGSAGLSGTSPRQPFTLRFTPPPSLTNVQAVPYAPDPDDQATEILLSFEPTTLAAGEFTQYVYQKRRNDAPFATDWRTIKVSRSPSDTTWRERYPASGGQYQYQVWQTKQVGQSQVNSDPVITPVVGIAFTGVVLSDVRGIDGDLLTIASIDRNGELEPTRGGNRVATWGGGTPALIEDGTYARAKRFVANLIYQPDDADTMGLAVKQPVLQQYNRLERLAKWRADRSSIVLLVRDGDGFAFMGRLTLGIMTKQTPFYWKVECTVDEVSTDVTLDGAIKALLANAEATDVSSIVEIV